MQLKRIHVNHEEYVLISQPQYDKKYKCTKSAQ